MQLKNIMNVADHSISMILIGVRPDNEEIGYDFEHHRWMDNNIINNPDRVITVGEFKKLLIYIKNQDCKLVDFSTMKKNHVKAFRDIEMARDTVLIVKIFLSCEKFPNMRAFTKKALGNAKKKHPFSANNNKKSES